MLRLSLIIVRNVHCSCHSRIELADHSTIELNDGQTLVDQHLVAGNQRSYSETAGLGRMEAVEAGQIGACVPG